MKMSIQVNKTIILSQISKIYLYLISVIVKPLVISTLYTILLYIILHLVA